MEPSELAPDTVIEEIATILADGYLRIIIAKARNQTGLPLHGIAPDQNMMQGDS